MNQHVGKQMEEMLNAAKEARIPENMQAFAQEGVARTREAYEKLTAASEDGVKAATDVLTTAQKGMHLLGAKAFENFTANTEAALDAAATFARAKTLPELARLQADFMQQQVSAAASQTKEFFELSTKVAQDTFQVVGTTATKAAKKATKG